MTTSSRAMLAMNSNGPNCTSCNALCPDGWRRGAGGQEPGFGTGQGCGRNCIFWSPIPTMGSESKSRNRFWSGESSLFFLLMDRSPWSRSADSVRGEERTRLSCPSSGTNSLAIPSLLSDSALPVTSSCFVLSCPPGLFSEAPSPIDVDFPASKTPRGLSGCGCAGSGFCSLLLVFGGGCRLSSDMPCLFRGGLVEGRGYV